MRAEPRRVGGLWLRLVALVLALAGAAHARPGDQQTELEDVRVLVSYDWPEMVYKGYFPVRLEVENNADRTRTVDVEFRQYGAGRGHRATRTFRVEPGRMERAELFLPAFPWANWPSPATYMAEVRTAGSRRMMGNVGPTQGPDLRKRPILWISPSGLGQDATGSVENLLSWQEDQGGHSVHWRHHNRERPFALKAGPQGGIVEISKVGFRAMPARYEGYTSVDAVVLDVRERLPEEERLDPLLAYARAGGIVAVIGPDAERLLFDSRTVRDWMEPRFESNWGEGCKTWRYGHGRLLATERPLTQEPQLGVFRDLLRGTPAWVPSDARSRSQDLQIPKVPGVEDLPYRGLAALLVLFALIIGPVNFIVLKRLRRPSWLLWTIPAISVCASLLLMGYGVVAQGLDVKSASRTLTLLDQRGRWATTVELRSFFAGLSPGLGLELEAGSSCYPISQHLDEPYFWVDFDRGGLLRGDFVPARRLVGQVLLSDRISRLRLDFLRTPEGFQVENGLGRVRMVILRDAAGAYFLSTGEIPEGGRGELRPVDDLDERPQLARVLMNYVLESEELLGISTYVALLETSPFQDDGGIEMNELLSEHAVVGVLPADEEDWR